MTIEDFKKQYAKEIVENLLSDDEILEAYEVYQEDPQQFHPNMFGSMF